MSYLSLHYHLVFSTKERRPFVRDQWCEELHKYLGGTINGLGGVSQQVGGVADHVHLLVELKATHTLADVVRELKKSSSTWVHDHTASVASPGRRATRHSRSVPPRGRRFAATSATRPSITQR